MVEGKNGDGRTVSVTVRIAIPAVSLVGVGELEALVADMIKSVEGAVYSLTISSPRPERPR